VLALNAVRVLAQPWFVRWEYGRGGFPDDPYGLTRAQRTELALVGLRSVRPGGEGIALLRSARLPGGRAAFKPREVRHMEDVRTWLGRLFPAHLAALGLLVVLGVVLGVRVMTRPALLRGLAGGALLTLALALLVVGAALVDYDAFESGFHGLLFAEGSWRFRETDTLRRLYPDRFWSDTATLVGGAAVVQALVLLGAVWQANRRLGRRVGR